MTRAIIFVFLGVLIISRPSASAEDVQNRIQGLENQITELKQRLDQLEKQKAEAEQKQAEPTLEQRVAELEKTLTEEKPKALAGWDGRFFFQSAGG